MCSNLDDLSDLEKKILRIKDQITTCKKCQGTPYVLIHKEHSYCKPCFDEYATHKFRSTIGKSKLVKKGNRILVAVSGGASSAAMLQLIREGLSVENQHRRLQFVPSLLHIDETAVLPRDTDSSAAGVKQNLSSYEFDCYFSSIAKSFRRSDQKFFVKNDASCVLADGSGEAQLSDALSHITCASSKDELIRRLRIQLIVDIAVAEGFDAIFLGSSGSRLSIQLITDVAQGKGNQIDLETGFVDDRFRVPILKPMREFVSKEIYFFIRMRGIPIFTTPDILTKSDPRQSLGKVTESFINSLESEFPSTTYSLCRISTKIRPKQKESDKPIPVCTMCRSLNDRTEPPECSALAALSLTKSLCNSNQKQESQFEQSLCYSCSRIVRESGGVGLQELHTIRQRAEIADFLMHESGCGSF